MLWFGQFLLLWKPPNGASLALMPGTRGPERRLAAAEPCARSTSATRDAGDSDLYDAISSSAFASSSATTASRSTDWPAPDADHHQFPARPVEDTPRLTTPRLAQD